MVGVDIVGILGPALHQSRGLEEEQEASSFGWATYGFTRDEHIVEAEYTLVFMILLVTTLLLQFYVGKVWRVSILVIFLKQI